MQLRSVLGREDRIVRRPADAALCERQDVAGRDADPRLLREEIAEDLLDRATTNDSLLGIGPDSDGAVGVRIQVQERKVAHLEVVVDTEQQIADLA